MLTNIPKYTTDTIDGVAIDAIDSLMYHNCSDVLEVMDEDARIKTFEERKRNVAKVLRLIECIPSIPSLDFISRAHVLFNAGVIKDKNDTIIRDVLIPYHRAFHGAPDIQMSPFNELVKGRLLTPIQDEKKFKEYVIKLQQLMRSRFPIMLSELYEKNELINKYNLNNKDFRNLQTSQNRKKADRSLYKKKQFGGK